MKVIIEILLGIFAIVMLKESLILFFCMWWAKMKKLDYPLSHFGMPALLSLATFGMTVFIMKIIYLK